MKILLLNGSPRPKGNTAAALDEMEAVFAAEGLETERVQVGNRVIRGCIACGKCAELGRCVFDDLVNELAPNLEACDGLVVGSPVYYASANATLVALLTRLFYSTPFDKTMKVGAAVAAARRGGLSSTLAVHSTWVLPQRIRQDPSANLLILGMISTGRSSSCFLPSMRVMDNFLSICRIVS